MEFIKPPEKDGLYENVPFEEYLQWDAVDQSLLKNGVVTMAHLKEAINNPKKQTKRMDVGSAIHDSILTPKDFEANYALFPEPDNFDVVATEFNDYLDKNMPDKDYEWCMTNFRKTKAWKEALKDFTRQFPDKTLLGAEDMEMVNAIQKNFQKRYGQFIEAQEEKHPEVSFVWTDKGTGLRCKGRADMLLKVKNKVGASEYLLIEIKTTEDASFVGFSRVSNTFGYPFQVAFYNIGLEIILNEVVEHLTIVVETKPPYLFHTFKYDEDDLFRCKDMIDTLLAKLAKGMKTGKFEGYNDSLDFPDSISLPPFTQYR